MYRPCINSFSLLSRPCSMHVLTCFSYSTHCQVSSENGHVEAVDSKGVRNLQAKVCSAVSKPKIKHGLTRKHHRAWTLSEVVKLVDGVARYGAGKWSEIRKLSFASYSYRTSVDLKVRLLLQLNLPAVSFPSQTLKRAVYQDKWRNLIRATQTQLPAQKDVSTCLASRHMSIVFLFIYSYH
jgi:hypothetical protein